MIQILVIITAIAIIVSTVTLIKLNYKKTLTKEFTDILSSMEQETISPEQKALISEIKNKLLNKLNNL
jgi:hypothetical protein